MSKECLFCRIARGEIPCKKVHEDDDLLAFHDINPAAPVHFLVIPKVHVENLYDADLKYQAVLGKMLGLAGQMARSQGCDDGFRVVINNGRVGRQEVYHLHMHIMGGPEPLRSGMPRP
ncbi:MAG TPA: histidine triad nucleotide-binding protein [Burkholderiaceae bacterium]|nr:histidine triad nucleotide-binding protein [Burkholderiaceae bacterium]